MKQLSIIITTFLFAAGMAGAQAPGGAPERANLSEAREARIAQQEELRAEREEARAERAAQREALRAQHEEFKSEVVSEREALRERLQNATSSEDREALREEAQAAREEWQAERAELRRERQAAIQNAISGRVQGYTQAFANANARGEDAIERLGNRLDDIAEVGVDVTGAQSTLGTASENLEAAYAQATDALGELEAIDITSGDAAEVKAALEQARESLSAAREAMRAAFEEIRNAARLAQEAVREYRESVGERAAESNQGNEEEVENDSQ